MCDEIVGSEKVVKYRRLFFKVYEYVQNNFLLPSKYLISGGSKAEGLDLPGSDLDIMLISKKYIVYRSKTETVYRLSSINKHILIIDTDNAQPGFALLFVQSEPICDQNCVAKNEDGTYLSSRLYVLSFATKYTDHKINGPCLSNLDGRLDAAHSLLCPEWPNVANNWTTRKRSSGWPSVFLVSDIVKRGVLLVPIAGQYPSALLILEFAQSLCSCEQFIISSLNDIHISDFKEQNITLNKYASHLRKLKYYTRWDISLHNTYTFDYLLQYHPHNNIIFFGTEFFLYYLRFACCHRLQDMDAIQQSLLDLESFRDDMRAEPYIMNSYRITFDKYLEYLVSEVYTIEKRKLCTNANY
ncbi:unnamed protein product [Mytilus coruscus]|uniref:Uncharacterized protein n=1 Tax=Mytilus coruscus TaxID=42192 RepID=A0A6J8ADW9_MYTCO|nr:unnamed protein product [Mytilus coruscus]